MPIRRELIDELLKETENPQAIFSQDGLLKASNVSLIGRGDIIGVHDS